MRERALRFGRSPWAVGLLLGLLQYARRVVDALSLPIQRFDEGIQLSAGWLLSQGEVPLRDFYQPYGPAFGVPGAIRQWVFGDSLLADRLVYMLAPAAFTAVAYVFVTRRHGWRFGLAAAVLTLASATPRYALCWLAIVGGLMIALRAIEAVPERSFAAAIATRPRTFLAAGSVIALAAWERGEYGLAAVAWAAFVLVAGRAVPRARRLALAVLPIAVAALPYALIAIAGGFDELTRWAGYAGGGFRKYRGQPIDLSPIDGWSANGSILLFSYVAGALLSLLWIAQLAARALGRRGPFEPDPTLVAPFLAILAAFATYAQSVRFSVANGAAVLAGISVAWLAQRPRVALLGPRYLAYGAAALVALAFLPALRDYPELPGDAIDLRHANRPGDPVPGLDYIPANLSDWQAESGIHALWRQRGLSGRRLLSTNSRNDLTYANGAYLYAFLGAKPGAWIVTFDPGLADDDDVQRDAVADLCRNRAAVVEEQLDPAGSSNGEFGYDNYRSRRLDEFVALNYRRDTDVLEYRLRLRYTASCADPDDVPAARVRALREEALRDDDLSRAGALSVLLVERAQKDGTTATPDDVAGALLGGYWVPDSQLPAGRLRGGLLALRDRAVRPGEAAAATAPGGELTRLATTTAYVTHRPPGAPQSEQNSVVNALTALMRDAARWPATFRNLSAMVPPDRSVVADARRHGGESRELERIRFESVIHGGTPREAIATGLRLARMSDRWPIDQGTTLVSLAALFDVAGDHGCAARARALGDSVPGVDALGPKDLDAPCGTALPAPSLLAKPR